MDAPQKTILVEGNIGAGKTTFLDCIAARYSNIEIVPEPIDKWVNFNGSNLLEHLYENPEKWSYTFQNYALLTYIESNTSHTLVAATPPKPYKFKERSIYSSRHCFAEAFILDGKIEQIPFNVYVKWFEFVESWKQNRTDLIIYLRTNPEIAYERMCKRNRNEEISVSFDYISRLHNLHEAWLYDQHNSEKRPTTASHSETPIFMFNANLPSTEIHTEYTRLHRFLTEYMGFTLNENQTIETIEQSGSNVREMEINGINVFS